MSLIVRSERVVLPDGVRPATITSATAASSPIGDVQRPACRRAASWTSAPHVVFPARRYARPHQRSRPCRVGGLRARDSRGRSRRRHDARGHAAQQHSGDHDASAALEEKRAAARGRCHVDVGFWGGVVPGNAARPGAAGARPACSASSASCARRASTSSGTSAKRICVPPSRSLRRSTFRCWRTRSCRRCCETRWRRPRRPGDPRRYAHVAREPSGRERAGRHRDARAALGASTARASTSSTLRPLMRCRPSARPARLVLR